jgi:hypothetical protein
MLALLVVLVTASSWYPFTLDLPRRVANTARQLADGAWDLDGHSLVVLRNPERMAASLARQQFKISIEAEPAPAEQWGPARLFSIGRHPHTPALMIGIDRREVVLYLPCGGGKVQEDAVWRFAMPAANHVSVSIWLHARRDAVPTVQVGTQQMVNLENRCPRGLAPAVPDATQPWALGNVYSGHRPFSGRISKLELDDGVRRIDLLREADWAVPLRYWIWPERLYEPSNALGSEILPTAWHLSSFALLGYFLAAVTRRRQDLRSILTLLAFAAVITAGKLFVQGRHPALADVAVHLIGAIVGLLAHERMLSK